MVYDTVYHKQQALNSNEQRGWLLPWRTTDLCCIQQQYGKHYLLWEKKCNLRRISELSSNWQIEDYMWYTEKLWWKTNYMKHGMEKCYIIKSRHQRAIIWDISKLIFKRKDMTFHFLMIFQYSRIIKNLWGSYKQLFWNTVVTNLDCKFMYTYQIKNHGPMA